MSCITQCHSVVNQTPAIMQFYARSVCITCTSTCILLTVSVISTLTLLYCPFCSVCSYIVDVFGVWSILDGRASLLHMTELEPALPMVSINWKRTVNLALQLRKACYLPPSTQCTVRAFSNHNVYTGQQIIGMLSIHSVANTSVTDDLYYTVYDKNFAGEKFHPRLVLCIGTKISPTGRTLGRK